MISQSTNPGFDSLDAKILIVILLPLSVIPFLVNTPSIAQYPGDAKVWVDQANTLKNTLDPFATIDPPLRYVLVAFVSALLPYKTNVIAPVLAGIFTFVGVPAALYYFSRGVVNKTLSVAVVLGFLTFLILRMAVPGYFSGSWQYDFAMPFALLGLAFAERLLRTRSKQLAILTGVSLGVAGLIQLSVTAVAVGAITWALSTDKRWRSLSFIGFVGLLFALFIPLHVILGPDVSGHLTARFAARYNGGELLAQSALRSSIITPGTVLVTLLLTLCFTVRQRIAAASGTILPVLFVYTIFFVLTKTTTIVYLEFLGQLLGLPFALVGIAIAGDDLLSNRIPTALDPRIVLAATGVLSAVFATVLVVAAPMHIAQG